MANVGDSRAILCRRAADGALVPHQLTTDHKPNAPGERARIEESSAVLLTEKEVRGWGDVNKVYVCRQRHAEIVYGVLFTRSIGDADSHKHLGIESMAEVTTVDVGDDDEFLVIATDGVWDHVSNEEVCSILQREGSDARHACDMLVENARLMWEENDAESRRDDITAVVVNLAG